MSKPLVFLTSPAHDKPLILNIGRNHECERINLTDSEAHRMMYEISNYLMVKAQRRGQ